MSEAVLDGFEKIASGIYLEGLAVDRPRNVIWYSDVIGGGVHGVKPDGTRFASLNETRMWTGGIMMNADGAVLSSGEGGIMWNNPDTGRSGWLIAELEGKPINGVNEMTPDGTGGIFFGTIDMERVIKGEATRPVALYRLTADREVIRLVDGIGFTNGLAHDQTRGKFYCNDTFRCTWVFDLGKDRTLENKRLFLEKDDVDGMALDAEGNVWITGFRSNFFTRARPDGSLLDPVATPAGSITQIRFAGADLRDCYFTSVPSEGGDTLKEGGQLTAKSSFLYRARSAVQGLEIAPAQFKL
jgi:sugar lactone lactonase YvrE